MGKHCKQSKSSVQCLFILLSFIYVVNAISEDELDDLLEEHAAVANAFGFIEKIDDMQVTYPNDFIVTPGTKASQLQVVSAPKVSLNLDPSDKYTLVLLDLSAYIEGDYGSDESDPILYWLVTNITGSDVDNGQVLESYKPPKLSTNPSSYKTHDFVFLVYSHNKNKSRKYPTRLDNDKYLLKYFREDIYFKIRGHIYINAGESVFGGPVAWNWFILEK